jgi:hypothetical protein
MSELDHIIDLGFIQIGEWFLSSSKLNFQLFNNRNETNVLYAFTSKEDVLYVGKTTQTIYRRMMGYKSPGPTQRTNIRNHANIQDLLEKTERVNIYALIEEDEYFFKGFRLNLAAGLEDSVINALRPAWNYLGKQHT